VRLTSATKNGKPAVGPVAPLNAAARGRSAARITSAIAAGADRAVRGEAPADDVEDAEADHDADPGGRDEHDDVLLAKPEDLPDEAGRQGAGDGHEHVRERDVDE